MAGAARISVVSARQTDPFSSHSLVQSSINIFEGGRFGIPGSCKAKPTTFFSSVVS